MVALPPYVLCGTWDNMTSKELTHLQERIGYTFKDPKLLGQALTHRSYLNEHPDWPTGHNERLEFLGDAVLELVVTEYLYEHYPSTPEGEMTNWRAALVNANMLSAITNDFDLNAHMLLSRGEARDTGRARQYILANAIEALIGAMYLDGGIEPCRTFIGSVVLAHLPEIISKKLYRDPKSLLQEEAQDRIGVTPTYRVMEEWGPDHARQFKIGVYLGRELAGEGQGESKQDAQQAAAEDALGNKKWAGR
jgi:ribonuclease-3